MPWNTCDREKAKRSFIEEWLSGGQPPLAWLCRRHGISRFCGYKWLRRFREGGEAGLRERSRRPASAQRLCEAWLERLRAAHLREPEFGAKKLHWKLRRDHPRRRVPDVRTLARWLKALGKVRTRVRRAPAGPSVRVPGRLTARCANDVWSADIKGSFCTGDGRQVLALTVRDLASRFVLCVRRLPQADEHHVGRVMRGLFGRYGLPRAIRCDNGAPFGGDGPRGWSRLSVQWVKLGIRPEYGRPRHPEDNPHHEQMHRVLKRDTAQPAAPNLRAQQRRFDRWREHYNQRRPHEALGMEVPAARYRRGRRELPDKPPSHGYPGGGELMSPDRMGRCFWRGRQRRIGKAFVNETLGGKPIGTRTLAVYFREHLIGTLHQNDLAGLRGVPRNTHQCKAGGATPLPAPTPIDKRFASSKL
jgi:putative transposase